MNLFFSEKNELKKGFVSMLALLLANTFLMIGISVFSVALKEISLTTGGRESVNAFYAADGGMECALYWDLQEEAFATSTPTADIVCNDGTITVTKTLDGGGGGESNFDFMFGVDNSFPCVSVQIVKDAEGGTIIRSYGVNVCALNARRRVERAWKVSY